jgi:hypothetical protein
MKHLLLIALVTGMIFGFGAAQAQTNPSTSTTIAYHTTNEGAPTKTSRVSSLVCWNLIGASFRLKLLLRDCI